MIRELHYDTVFDAQRHFRVLLDSMARPGKINVLDDVMLETPQELGKAAALVGLALLDSEASFWVESYNIAEYFNLNTGSFLTEVNKADFLFIHNETNLIEVEAAKIGSLQYPEQGATLVIQIDLISDVRIENSIAVVLRGPGVKEEKMIYLKGVKTEWLELIQSKNEEFPTGVDVIFTDQNNRITCVPRSNQFSFKIM